MASDAQRRAVAKYDKEHTRFFGLKLNYTTDAALIEKLESVESKQTYLKGLIRADLDGRTGRWDDTGPDCPSWLRCSECGHLDDTEWPFCPQCGSEMENGREELSVRNNE